MNITRIDAENIAKRYGLDYEVLYDMDVKGLTPEEALSEWDLL